MTAVGRLQLSFLILLGVAGLGVLGYVALEGWPFLDALYMTVHTLATIGFGETRPLHTAGRIFTIVLIIGGVSAAGFIVRSMAEVIAGDHLRKEFRQNRMERQLATIRDHQIVCGYGRMGRALCEELKKGGTPFVVIERDPGALERLAAEEMLHVAGDASDDETLLTAGVERAHSLIAVASTDELNVFIVLSARALNPTLRIVARSEYEHDEHKLRRAGADHVVSPYVIGARQIASACLERSAGQR